MYVGLPRTEARCRQMMPGHDRDDLSKNKHNIPSGELEPQQTLKSLNRLQSFPVKAYLCVYFKSEVLFVPCLLYCF